MNNLSNILESKRFEISKDSHKLNTTYEEAKEFAEYCGLNVIFVLSLFKRFGKQKVLNEKSWIADVPYDPSKGKAGLIYWRMKQV